MERDGEKGRYIPFEKLHNRQLLWHGSRTANYAGILSQGLRIAPPQAPSVEYYYYDDILNEKNFFCNGVGGKLAIVEGTLLC